MRLELIPIARLFGSFLKANYVYFDPALGYIDSICLKLNVRHLFRLKSISNLNWYWGDFELRIPHTDFVPQLWSGISSISSQNSTHTSRSKKPNSVRLIREFRGQRSFSHAMLHQSGWRDKWKDAHEGDIIGEIFF